MPATIDRRATRVTRRLHHDRDLMRRFRAAPHEVLASEGLTRPQIAAVMSGNAHDLATAGIDPERVRRMPVGMRLRARALTVLATTMALLGGPLLSAPATAERIAFTRFGRRFIRLDARRIGRAEVRARAARAFSARTVFLTRLVLPGQNGCYKYCAEVEIIP